MHEEIRIINEMVRAETAFLDDLFREMERTVVGQKALLERLFIGLLCGGHLLIEGVPGLAKTTAVKTLAEAIDVAFKRIQFTPDLLPADLLGTMIYNQKTEEFVPKKGPLFSNIILADEINRAPAKVQSALLEAMQEKQVTIGDTTFPLDDPFMVLATQNPIEQEGTYQLPEAQVDRFMLKIRIDYPSKEDELKILDRYMDVEQIPAKKVITVERIRQARSVLHQIYLDEKVKHYILDVVFASRKPADYGLNMDGLIEYGASPRATLYLAQAAKAHAFIKRRGYVTPEDIKLIGYDVLRHRITPSYEAEAEGIDSEGIVRQIFDGVPVP
ncbi:MAG: AAA family ATPase [bacterium]